MANENKTAKKNQEYYMIDFQHIIKYLWKKVWLIILVGILGAVIGFSYATFMVTPMYSSAVMLYVNNSSFSLGTSSFSISSSELTAAQSLVKTYTVILKNRTTLNLVNEKLEGNYTYEQLYGMVSANSVNETEVLKVSITTDDPKAACSIANAIAEVLPVRISEIIEGSSMEVVDTAVVDTHKVSPNVTRHTELGFIIAAVACVILLVIVALLDDTIHDEEYIHRTYDYPILAKVPNLLGSSEKQYAYYYQRKKGTK